MLATHVVVLAAGKGKRMRSDLAKVLHEAAGWPLLTWVLAACESVSATTTLVVVGHQAERVAAILPPGVVAVHQEKQLGTGHAVQVALAGLDAHPDDTIVVIPGDMPLVRPETLRALVSHHLGSGASATLVTSVVDDPTGYGRVVRDGDRVQRIVEETDASEGERTIKEINTSVYALRAGALIHGLAEIDNDNIQGELYLTDVVGVLAAEGHDVAAITVPASEAMGVNTIAELAEAGAALERRAELPSGGEVSHQSPQAGYAARSKRSAHRERS